MTRKTLALLIALTVATVGLIWSQTRGKVPHGPAGKSNIAHAYLVEKNPSGWSIVEGGAWGKLKYNLSGSTFDFVFNGHGLALSTAFSLIYYPDPWPGTGLIVLGTGTSDPFGDVHIIGAIDTGDLPAPGDPNPDAKVWLVVSADVDNVNHMMQGWQPNEYLFEYDLVNFDDTDVP